MSPVPPPTFPSLEDLRNIVANKLRDPTWEKAFKRDWPAWQVRLPGLPPFRRFLELRDEYEALVLEGGDVPMFRAFLSEHSGQLEELEAEGSSSEDTDGEDVPDEDIDGSGDEDTPDDGSDDLAEQGDLSSSLSSLGPSPSRSSPSPSLRRHSASSASEELTEDLLSASLGSTVLSDSGEDHIGVSENIMRVKARLEVAVLALELVREGLEMLQ